MNARELSVRRNKFVLGQKRAHFPQCTNDCKDKRDAAGVCLRRKERVTVYVTTTRSGCIVITVGRRP